MVTETIMNKKQITQSVFTALVAALGSACSQQAAPKAEMLAVNDENCKPESITRIADEDARKKFGSMCFGRGKFKPSPKQEW